MAVICPTVLAQDITSYKRQLYAVTQFRPERIQIDLTDGVFTSSRTVRLSDIVLPPQVKADIHLMYAQPVAALSTLLRLHPHMVIVHAEAEGEFLSFAQTLHEAGILVGIALLPETSPDALAEVVEHVDHILIFAGHLGHYGGHADMSQLSKIAYIKRNYPHVETGWDGGVTAQNVRTLAEAGVDIINVGSAIQNAQNPRAAYATLQARVSS